jgi:hypothetical protein
MCAWGCHSAVSARAARRAWVALVSGLVDTLELPWSLDPEAECTAPVGDLCNDQCTGAEGISTAAEGALH